MDNESMNNKSMDNTAIDAFNPPQKAHISIHYCRQCNWMLRASWLCQELLHTFSEEVEQVALHPDTGGRFEIFCNGERIWERKIDGGFPEAKILKQRVRNIIAPEKDLGHSDSK